MIDLCLRTERIVQSSKDSFFGVAFTTRTLYSCKSFFKSWKNSSGVMDNSNFCKLIYGPCLRKHPGGGMDM